MKPATPLIHHLLSLLPPLNRLVISEARAEIGEDVTMAQFRVLTLLAEGPLTVSALARARLVSLQAMSELVQQLVARGWLEREPDPRDRRQTLLNLTDTGRTYHQHIQERLVEHLARLLEPLSEYEHTALSVALPALQRVLSRDIFPTGGQDGQ